MKYFLQRDGRTFGPYSFDDLKRYQSENRIGPTDLIRKEDSQQWEPWQQVLNPPAAPAAAPVMPPLPPSQPSFGGGGFTPPAGPAPGGFGHPPQQGFGEAPGGFGTNPPQGGGFGQAPASAGFGGAGFGQPQPPAGAGGFGSYGTMGSGGAPFGGGGFGTVAPSQGAYAGSAVGPMPPDMQWWLVLIIGMFTCGLFLVFWIWKQASFVKRIDPSTDAPKFYLYALVLYVGGYVLMLGGALLAAAMGSDIAMVLPMIGQLILLGGVVCLIVAAFKMRAAIHNYYTMVEPMGINLMDTTGAVLTFFFSPYFFQYHFANIAARKKAMGHPSS